MTPAEVMLATAWAPDGDPSGWWLTEKYDGVRALWTGAEFVSRNGRPFRAPAWYLAGMPSEILDGELWAGRGRLSVAAGAARSAAGDWRTLQYVVFDRPGPEACEARQAALRDLRQSRTLPPHVIVCAPVLCTGRAHMETYLHAIIAAGGEGVVLRAPGSWYEEGRSEALRKLKRATTGEARIVGYVPGCGEAAGTVGALRCVWPGTGAEFGVAAGLTPGLRHAPPPVGAVVTVRYLTVTAAGVPREPVLVGVRDYE